MTSSQETLQKAFGFTSDDLRANAFGDISERQAASLMKLADTRMKAQREWLYRAAWLTLVVVGALLVAGNRADAVVLIGIGLVYLPLLAWMMRHYQRLGVQITDDMTQRRARMVCGQLHKSLRSTEDGTRMAITVDEQTFNVDANQFDALNDNESYCLFYSIHTRVILSVWRYENRYT